MMFLYQTGRPKPGQKKESRGGGRGRERGGGRGDGEGGYNWD